MTNDKLVRALEPAFYTDPDIFKREHNAIFFRTWQYAGHVSQVAEKGEYFTFGLNGQPLFIIRDGDEVRAFYNVCPHRAHELVSGAGQLKRIVCPYHAWTYQTDGSLMAAPNSDKVDGFHKSDICITPVRLEIFCGFIFVNLDADAKSMSEWYPDVAEELRDFVPHIDDLKPYKTNAVAESCNWKVTVENYSECYHCPLNHPTFANGVIDPKTYDIRPQGYCLRHTTVSANLDQMNYEIDATANARATEYSSWFLWPTFSFQVYPGNVLNTYFFKPDDHLNTTVYRDWYTVDGNESGVIDGLAQQDLDTTVAEDIRLVESVQRGLASKGYRAGPLIIDPDFGVASEHSVHSLNTWVREALGMNGADYEA
ncbi:MAG: aromatic ring-hydroxylating dioxygenase subunit alpha [Rhodospirillales bacterium]|nr:aromatic ring-hydroxylating dioxygenase subunit alpha [Rhodospirillales bacterium]